MNIDFTKKCYVSQFVRDKNSHKYVVRYFFLFRLICMLINKFCQKCTIFAFITIFIFAYVATLSIRNVVFFFTLCDRITGMRWFWKTLYIYMFVCVCVSFLIYSDNVQFLYTRSFISLLLPFEFTAQTCPSSVL